MSGSDHKELPTFDSLDELVEFFDTHDMGDYWEGMPEAQVDVSLNDRTHLIAIDAELAGRLAAIARQRQTSTGSLIDSWLREKVAQS